MLIKKIVYILFCLITFQGFSQEFAPKDYYLIDSLGLEELSESDRTLVETSLKEFHAAKDDTSRVKALNGICERMMHDDWAKYNYWVYTFWKES